jgi:NADH:ubiquinone oxidoreductase subunit K
MLNKVILYFVVVILIAFALLTFFLSTSIIFDLFDVRAKEGNYVLFVVWANFVSSILYLISAYGLLKTKKWTYQILGTSTLMLIATLIGFLLYIQAGGIHESRTIAALIFRTTLTVGFTAFAYFTINRKFKK